MIDPTLKTCTFEQLKTRIIYAVKANDRAKIAILTAECNRRIAEKGGQPVTSLTTDPVKLERLRATRAAMLAS